MNQNQNPQIQAIDPLNLKDDLKSAKAVLIDVRERNEWEQIHVNGAHLKPLSELRTMNYDQLNTWLNSFAGKRIYLHCRSGGRTLIAAGLLKELHPDIVCLAYGTEQLLQMQIEL